MTKKTNLMPSEKTIFICDFDGTITVADTLVSVFDEFCTGNWWEIENSMRAGHITRTDALFKEVSLMDAEELEVSRHLDNYIEIRDGFSNFLKMVQTGHHELLIRSFPVLTEILIFQYHQMISNITAAENGNLSLTPKHLNHFVPTARTVKEQLLRSIKRKGIK